MKTLSIRETRNKLPELERMVEREGEILITRHGKPVARLLPVAGRKTKPKPDHGDLRRRMPRLKTGSESLISAERDQH